MASEVAEIYIPPTLQAIFVNQCARVCRQMMRKKLREGTFVVGDVVEVRYTLRIDGPFGLKFETTYGLGDEPFS